MDFYTRGIVNRRKGDAPPSGQSLVASDEQPIYGHTTLKLIGPSGSSLNTRIVELVEVNGGFYVAEYREEFDFREGLLACAYHVERIIQLYADRTVAFEQANDHRTLRGNTSDPRVYYEVSAFVMAARTWYEALRRVLETRVAPAAKEAPSFSALQMAPPPEIEASYGQLLKSHWATWGDRLNRYRNVIVHEVSLAEWGHTCWFEPIDGRFGVTQRLPLDPKVPREQFDYENGPDSLEFCYQLLCEMVNVAEATCALPEIRDRLGNPPQLKPSTPHPT